MLAPRTDNPAEVGMHCFERRGLGIPAYKGGTEPWGAFALRAWGYCGASGRKRYLNEAKRILAGKD